MASTTKFWLGGTMKINIRMQKTARTLDNSFSYGTSYKVIEQEGIIDQKL